MDTDDSAQVQTSRQLVRPRHRREDNNKIDLQQIRWGRRGLE